MILLFTFEPVIKTVKVHHHKEKLQNGFAIQLIGIKQIGIQQESSKVKPPTPHIALNGQRHPD